MHTLQEISSAALMLPIRACAELFDSLRSSLESEPIDPKVLAEGDRRASELEEGKVKGLTIEESRQRVREKLPWLS